MECEQGDPSQISYIRSPSAELQLPPTFTRLIEAGAWDTLTGFGGTSLGVGFNDVLLSQTTGGSPLYIKRRPFGTYAAWAGPRNVDTPEERLLAMIFAKGSEAEYFARVQDSHRDLQSYIGLDQLEPSLAVTIAEVDPSDIPTLILDYRDDPPCVRRHVQRTLDRPADWAIVARTFDDFADMVGLHVDGPLYWLPYGNGSTLGTSGEGGGVIHLDHHHPLGLRITAEIMPEGEWTITCMLAQDVLHIRRLSRSYHFDLTGPMKRALGEMAIVGFPRTLVNEFVEQFDDPPRLR